MGDTANNIVQMNQVQFTCNLKDGFQSINFNHNDSFKAWTVKNYWKSFQQDAAAAVVINDGTLVANPNDYTINLRDQVE